MMIRFLREEYGTNSERHLAAVKVMRKSKNQNLML